MGFIYTNFIIVNLCLWYVDMKLAVDWQALTMKDLQN